jgi:adenylate cyclase
MASIFAGYEYDIFISYRQKDNKYDGWVTEFVDNLKRELDATFKEELSVYFDANPHDGLLETHNVDASLKDKLRCLVFIPIISQTYCDVNCFAWRYEFAAFNKLSKGDKFGREIRLPGGNVASRILPVKIHNIDPEDKLLIENELGGELRAIEFIYKEAGVNRSLKPLDNKKDNLNKTDYRNQVNKVANAIKEIFNGLKAFDGVTEEVTVSAFVSGVPKRLRKITVISFFVALVIILSIFVYLLFPGYRTELQKKSNVIQSKSIAVLPFVNMSDEPDQQYFSDGLTDGILNSLAHLKDLKVSARASSFLFRNKDPREAGKKLDVGMVLEGSVQRQGDNIRITARLIDTENGFDIWSQQYTEDPEDIFAVQDKIANSIAEKLEVTFLGNIHQIKTKKPTESKEALELYLKGRFFWNQGTPSALNKGIGFFQQALALDPLYAEAYSGLADSYTSLGYGSFLAPKDAIPRAKEAAAKALEIDSTLAEPHASIGFFSFYYDWNGAEAEKEFKTAIALNPNYALAYAWYGYYLTAMGKYDEARENLNKAEELDPLSAKINTDMGFSIYYSGNYDQAISVLKASLEMNPKLGLTHVWLARIYQAKKLYPQAIAEYRETLNVLPNWSVALAGIGNIYGEEGKKAEAMKMLDTLKLLSAKKYVTSYGIALVYCGIQDKDKTFELLDRAYEERSNWMVWLKSDPRWAYIRSDRRYKELVRKVGLLL